jgi:hypothetical protein
MGEQPSRAATAKAARGKRKRDRKECLWCITVMFIGTEHATVAGAESIWAMQGMDMC